MTERNVYEPTKKATDVDDDDDMFSPMEEVLFYFLRRAGVGILVVSITCYVAWRMFFK